MLRQKSYIGRIFRIAFGITVLAVLFLTGGADAADPDLVVTELIAPDQASVKESIQINWTVKNQGDGTAITPWQDIIYLSNDSQLDDSDTFLYSYWRGMYGGESLALGESYNVSINIGVPNTLPGDYYLIVNTDNYFNSLPESNEDNNIITKPIVIKKSDLVVTYIFAYTNANENIIINWTVKNQGDGTAITPWQDGLYLSNDSQLDDSDTFLYSYWRGMYGGESLAPGESYNVSINTNIPDGDYYFILRTDDYYNYLPESNEDNNILAKPITINKADLLVTEIIAPDQSNVGENIIINFTVRNQGGSYAGEWEDDIYLSNDTSLDDSDIYILHSVEQRYIAAGESYTESFDIRIPDMPIGDYYIIVKTDGSDLVVESKEWNNALMRHMAIGIDGGFSEIASNQSTLVEDLLSQKANLSSGIVKGDLNGTFSFTDFEIVSVNSGSFAGKGFSKGEWLATLEGTSYRGRWEGVSYFIPAEKRIYLKGSIAGGEASGIVEGYLTESIPDSGIYDRYHATWRLGRLADRITSVTLNLEGNLSFQGSSGYPSTRIYVLQTSVEGTTFGDYKENLSTVLTHLRVSDETNPYHGQGFSIISYTSNSGQGEGWAYNRLVASGKTELRGMFTRPLQGIVYGTLDETSLPRKLSFTIERIDLGLPPAPDLRVKIWGPQRLSPGQTVEYIIEYSNIGLKTMEYVDLIAKLPLTAKYLSSTNTGTFNSYSNEVTWNIANIKPKSNAYLSTKNTIVWGLPVDTLVQTVVYIPLNKKEVYVDPSILSIFTALEERADYANVTGTISNATTSASFDFNVSVTEVSQNIDPSLEVTKTGDGIIHYHWKFTADGHSTDYVDLTLNMAERASEMAETSIETRDAVAARNEHGSFLDALLSEGLIGQATHDNLAEWNDFRPIIPFLRQGIGNLPYVGWIERLFPQGTPFGSKFANDALWNEIKYNLFQKIQERGEIWGETNPNTLNDINSLDSLYELFKKKQSQATSLGTSVIAPARDPNIKYGPEGFVLPSQKLNYTVEFENEGEGIAFGVYFIDILDEDLDATTLEIGPVISTIDGSVIAPVGTYNPSTRTITWLVGEVGSNEGGYANLSVNFRGNAEEGTEIINYATVYFPSVPETTRTNGIVSVVDITPPRYSNVNQNKSVVTAGESVEVSSYWQDGVQLNYTWLETNESGTWQNVSYIKLSGSEAWSNFTIQTIREGVACWRIHANDTAGNENSTSMLCFDVQPSLDAMPPLSITEPGLLAAGVTWLNFTWNNPPDADFSHVMLYLNDSFITNVYAPQNFYNVTGLSPDTFYELSTQTVDTSGNMNETWLNATARTLSLPDMAPPAGVDLLHNTTYSQTYINWTWTDPADSDFANVSVWIDGVFKDNIQKAIQFYNATGFVPDTEHTIATRTIDSNGNINQTWQNHTARTAPEVTIPPVKVKLTFIVTDNNLPIANATIQSGGNFRGETNENGTVAFEVPIGVYKYAVREKGYVRATGTVTVADETTVNVKLTPRK